MLRYNTQQPKMILPEYGRHVHQMVSYCLGIEDRQKRTECAYDIAAILTNMFPELAPTPDRPGAVWDVINMISDFKLDIDFPVAVTPGEKLRSKPSAIELDRSRIRFRHYGKIIERMIEKVSSMPESEEQKDLALLIASHMKKLMLQHNREGADDIKIFRDLECYSQGKIILSPETCVLPFFEIDSPETMTKTRIQKKKNNKNQKRKKR